MHEITEGTDWNQACQKDRRNKPLVEASSVTPDQGVRLKVHR